MHPFFRMLPSSTNPPYMHTCTLTRVPPLTAPSPLPLKVQVLETSHISARPEDIEEIRKQLEDAGERAL